MPGPLAHSNTTGLALALGLVLSVSRYKSTHKVLINVLFILIFSVALILCGGRTAILAGIVGSMTAVFFTARISLAKMLSKFILILMLLIATMTWMITSEVIDPSAFKQIYNIAKSAETVSIMVSADAIKQYCEQVITYPFVLLTGVGPATPATSGGDLLNQIGTDDIYIVSLLSQYGIVLPVLLSFALWVTFRKALIDTMRYGDTFLRSLLSVSLGCVVAFVVSTVHTNALMKPQLFPMFFIFLAIISIVRKAINCHSTIQRIGRVPDNLRSI
jgi:hypothetical protein